MTSAPSDWFRSLLDTAHDMYFRYTLVAPRRFEYLSPSVHALTGRPAEDFQADPALCLGLIVREDRRVLRQIVRARRGLTITLRIVRAGEVVPVELRTVSVIRNGQVTAVEGMVRVAPVPLVEKRSRGSQDGEGTLTQQRLAALMYEVHDLLHRTLPPLGSAPARPNTILTVGEIVLDTERLTAAEAGKPVALTTRELLVLRYFIEHPGRVVTRQQLLTDVWGYSYTGDDRTVDVHVSRLRRKLPSLRARLVSVKHLGYRLDADRHARRIANC